jgi:hypothetical protein
MLIQTQTFRKRRQQRSQWCLLTDRICKIFRIPDYSHNSPLTCSPVQPDSISCLLLQGAASASIDISICCRNTMPKQPQRERTIAVLAASFRSFSHCDPIWCQTARMSMIGLQGGRLRKLVLDSGRVVGISGERERKGDIPSGNST